MLLRLFLVIFYLGNFSYGDSEENLDARFKELNNRLIEAFEKSILSSEAKNHRTWKTLAEKDLPTGKDIKELLHFIKSSKMPGILPGGAPDKLKDSEAIDMTSTLPSSKKDTDDLR